MGNPWIPIQTSPTPFPDLNAVLSELVTELHVILGDNFTGAYLHGSFAVGDFDADSDVDFLVVIREEVSDSQRSALQSMHARIYDLDSAWAQHLEGSYITEEALRGYDPTGEPLLYLDNCSSKLIRSNHDNTLVVRMVLRQHGITLVGPDVKTLIDSVAVGDLQREVMVGMRDWAAQIFGDPEQMNNRWYQSFAIITYCRMLYTLHTGVIGSKPVSAQWGQYTLDSQWAGLIQRARNERPNPSLKVRQPADPEDFKITLGFIEYALDVAESLRLNGIINSNLGAR